MAVKLRSLKESDELPNDLSSMIDIDKNEALNILEEIEENSANNGKISELNEARLVKEKVKGISGLKIYNFDHRSRI